jgi:PIN domain nuclease of toxin-antitoxin system
MPKLLLDTHALLWVLNGDRISSSATLAIAAAQREAALHVSPISAWEIGVALGKDNPVQRPALNGLAPDKWFKAAVRDRYETLSRRISMLRLISGL